MKVRAEIKKSNQPSYDDLAALVLQLKQENDWLKEQLNLMRHHQFAQSSENSNQLNFFDEVKSPDNEECDTQTVSTYTRKKSKPGNKIDTAKLPRDIIEHDLDDAQKLCACGCEMDCVGSDHSETLDFIPSKIKVIEHITYKYACRRCETLKQAKKPEAPLGKMMATVALLVEIILKKYQAHLPYYRQSKIFKQHGIDIPDNTLANWVMKGGECLMPLYDALTEELKHIRRLQVDESPIKVLAQSQKGYVWCYYSYEATHRFCLYHIAEGRSSAPVNERLKDYKGILQTDGYYAYNGFRAREDVITPGCWAHTRRKFFDVLKSKAAGYPMAAKFVRLIDQLFDIESKHIHDTCARHQQRKKQSKEIIDKIKALHEDCLKAPITQSSLGSALTYLNNQWPYLILFLDHEHIELSTNWVENAIRPFALGRRNWLFINSIETGKVTGLFYSLIQTCIINEVDPRQYLTTVLNYVPQLRRNEVNPRDLLPQFIDRQLLV